MRGKTCRTTWLALLLAAAVPAWAQDIKVTLLGTGTPSPAIDRFGPSTLVEVAGHKFLFDAGRGALQRLAQVKVRWQDVDGVFLTHLHSDHVVGLPDLWLTGWLVGQRARPLRIRGPKGTSAMTKHLEQAFSFDVRWRIDDDKAVPDGAVLLAEDIEEGVVLETDGMKITAFRVDHAPVEPALGYRIDYRGRSVALSGDTRPSTNLVRNAEGVDLLVHEVISPEALQRAGIGAAQAKSRIEHHTTAEQAGGIFASIRPRLAVYSHIGPPSATAQDLMLATRKRYAGPVEVGEDLMVIAVGETVDVTRPARPAAR